MSSKFWKFVNPLNPLETITVQDLASAQTLKAILNSDGNSKWLIEESENDSTSITRPNHSNLQDKTERRNEKRFPAVFRVILVSGSSSFRTTSVDVSSGGMLLSQKIPSSFSGKKCIAYINGKDTHESLELICNIVGDPNDLKRISFCDTNSETLRKLEAWTMSHA